MASGPVRGQGPGRGQRHGFPLNPNVRTIQRLPEPVPPDLKTHPIYVLNYVTDKGKPFLENVTFPALYQQNCRNGNSFHLISSYEETPCEGNFNLFVFCHGENSNFTEETSKRFFIFFSEMIFKFFYRLYHTESGTPVVHRKNGIICDLTIDDLIQYFDCKIPRGSTIGIYFVSCFGAQEEMTRHISDRISFIPISFESFSLEEVTRKLLKY